MSAIVGSLLVRVGGDLTAFRQAMQEMTGQARDSAAKVQGSLDKLIGMGGKLAAGLGLAGIGTGAIAAARKFEEAEFTIRRVTGATGERLEELQNSFVELYKHSARSSEEVVGALSKIAVETRSAGPALEALTKANLAFAKVTSTDVRSAVEGTQTVFKQWGIAATEQAAKLDYLYRVSQTTGIGTQKLTSQIAAVGPTLRAMGFTFEETVLLVGNFEEKGKDAAEVTGALGRAMGKFAAEGKEPKAALAALVAELQNAPTPAEALRIALEKVGGKAGALVGLVDAARSGALNLKTLGDEVAKNTDTVSKAAAETKSWTARLKEFQHQLESVVASHAQAITAMSVGWLTFGGVATSVRKGLYVAIINIISALRFGMVEALTLGQKALFGFGIALPIAAVGLFLDKITQTHRVLHSIGELLLGPVGVVMNVAKGARGAFGSKPGMVFPVGQGSAPVALAGAVGGGPAAPAHGVGPATEIESFGKALQAIPWHEASLAGMALNDILQRQQEVFRDVAKAAADYRWAFEKGNLEVPPAIANYVAMSDAAEWAIDPTRKLTEAQFGLNAAWADAIIKFSRVDPDVQARGIKDFETWQKAGEKAVKTVSASMTAFDREVRRVMDNLSRTMSQGIWNAKSFGEAMTNMLKGIAEAITEYAIKRGFAKLILSMDGVMSKLGALGKALTGWAKGVSGVASGGASTAANAAEGGAGTVASAGGGGIAGAASGWMGAVNMVSGLVNMGANIANAIGTFRLEGTMNAVEWNTRKSSLHLQAMLDLMNIHLPKLESIWGYLWEIQAPAWKELLDGVSALGGKPGGGTAATFEFNNCNFGSVSKDDVDRMMNEAFTQAAAAGIIP